MKRAVIFDCFGVLYGGSLFVLLNICRPERRQELIDCTKQNDYGMMTSGQYLEAVADILEMPVKGVKALFRRKRVRNEPLFELIREIRQRGGVKIGLLTNAGKEMPKALFSDEELNGGLFDAVLVSSEYGIAKPNPEIFEMIAGKLGATPGDCLMVDDTFENCNGAEVAGMKAVWYADNKTAEQHILEFINNA